MILSKHAKALLCHVPSLNHLLWSSSSLIQLALQNAHTHTPQRTAVTGPVLTMIRQEFRSETFQVVLSVRANLLAFGLAPKSVFPNLTGLVHSQGKKYRYKHLATCYPQQSLRLLRPDLLHNTPGHQSPPSKSKQLAVAQTAVTNLHAPVLSAHAFIIAVMGAALQVLPGTATENKTPHCTIPP